MEGRTPHTSGAPNAASPVAATPRRAVWASTAGLLGVRPQGLGSARGGPGVAAQAHQVRPVPEVVLRLAAFQDGVVTAAQLVEAGVDLARAARLVDAGLWRRSHRGIYVVHNGRVSWQTRARGAVAYAGPGAALSRRAAGHVHGILPTPPALIEIDVPAARTVTRVPGLSIRRRRVMPAVTSAVVDAPDTVLDLVADAPDVDAVVALLCAAARARVPGHRVVEALGRRQRFARRTLVLDVVGEVADGVESPLERRYRGDVEQAHGLPRSTLQRRDRVAGRNIRSDVEYVGLGVRAELDGRLAHLDRDADDVWRDNAVLVERGQVTLRYRWAHVVGAPCATATQVARALQVRGWRGQIRPCGPSCRAT